MEKLIEALQAAVACVPVSLAASTDSTPIYLPAAKNHELAFAVTTGALASGKKLTVAVYGATDSSGTGAVKLGEKVFTASGALTSAVAFVSVKPRSAYSHYGVKFQHDSAAAVVCGAAEIGSVSYLPAGNDWALSV